MRGCGTALCGPQYLLYIFLLFCSSLNAQWNKTDPWFLSSLCLEHTKTARLPTPFCLPSSCDPCDLCSVTSQLKDPMLELPWQWPWRVPVRRALVLRNTRLHTAAKPSDRYSIICRVAKGGGVGEKGRVALQRAHCRDTGEIRTRARGCLSARVTESVRLSWKLCLWEGVNWSQKVLDS